MAGSGPVKSPRPSEDLAWPREAKRAAGQHRNEKLITLAEVQPLADLGGKNQPTAVAEVNRKRVCLGHVNNLPHRAQFPTTISLWEPSGVCSGMSLPCYLKAEGKERIQSQVKPTMKFGQVAVR